MPHNNDPKKPKNKPLPEINPEMDPSDIPAIPLPPEEELDIIPDEEEELLDTPPYEEPEPGEGP